MCDVGAGRMWTQPSARPIMRTRRRRLPLVSTLGRSDTSLPVPATFLGNPLPRPGTCPDLHPESRHDGREKEPEEYGNASHTILTALIGGASIEWPSRTVMGSP